MEQPRTRRRSAAPAKKSASWIAACLVILAAIGVFLPAALLLLGVGLVPAATAYITDREPGRPLFRTVLPLNLTGVMVYVVALWHDRGGLEEAIKILEAPLAWLVIYGAAGLGSLLHFAMPALITVILKDRLRRRRMTQERLIESMRAEWGVEVCPPDDPESAG